MHLTIRPLSKDDFAPFGDVFTGPAGESGKADYLDPLVNLRGQARPRLTIAHVSQTLLPLDVRLMERHAFSSQAFLPLECVAYLVIVAPHHPKGGPDMAHAQAFRVPGTVAINYHANVWHHPLTALDAPARFATLTFIDAGPDDEEFVSLPGSIRVDSTLSPE